MNIVALIPTYNPSDVLIRLVQELSKTDLAAIVVVDDGSDSRTILNKISKLKKTDVLTHAVNQGKGTALKTGLNHIYCSYPEAMGVITLDSDGQHLVADALKVAHRLHDHPNALILGVRRFAKNVPLRSKLGNEITKFLYRLVIGGKISDTQSGLRGIPRSFIPQLLKLGSSGYEFELDMLLASKHSRRNILEESIQTIYVENNKSSHFNPIADSMKIYFVLLRFVLSSLLTSVVDYSIFLNVYNHGGNLVASQSLARFGSMLFNYWAVRKFVFYSEQKQFETFPKYVSLVVILGCVSYLMIQAFTTFFTINVVTAKLSSELIIFLANFAIQRDFIFTRSKNPAVQL